MPRQIKHITKADGKQYVDVTTRTNKGQKKTKRYKLKVAKGIPESVVHKHLYNTFLKKYDPENKDHTRRGRVIRGTLQERNLGKHHRHNPHSSEPKRYVEPEEEPEEELLPEAQTGGNDRTVNMIAAQYSRKKKELESLFNTLHNNKSMSNKKTVIGKYAPAIYDYVKYFVSLGDKAPESFRKTRIKAQKGGKVVIDSKTREDRKEYGLSTDDIDKVMHKYSDFYGAIARNEIKGLIPKIKPNTRVTFVMNTDPNTKSGEHWVSCYIDARPGGSQSVEWYNSYAEKCPKDVEKDIKAIIDKLDSETYLKFKENRVIHQNNNSNNCGYFACQFLIDRYRGKTFAEATGYEDKIKDMSKSGEKEIEHLKKQAPFSFIGF